MLLDRARAALAKQDFAAARDLLIAAWRVKRVPAIADLVDLVAPQAPDALTEQLASVIASRVAATEKNLELVRELDDPRVSRFAIDMLLKLPFQGPSARPLLLAFVDVIEARKDARLVTASRTILAGVATRVTPLAARQEIGEAIEQLTAILREDTPETSVEEDAQLGELAKLVEPLQRSTRSAEALLADVYANPEDDAPRLVLADLLLERGDPRGEFIALQVERARTGVEEPSEREAQLLKKHGKEWLGVLAPILSWGKGYATTEFRRAFIAKADFILSIGNKLEPLRAEVAWSTVEELDGVWPDNLLWTAPLRALHTINRPLDLMSYAEVARRPLPTVRTLRLHDPTVIDPVVVRAAFPNLDRVLMWYGNEKWQDVDAIGRLGVQCLEVTNNWYERGEARARAELEARLAAIEGKPALMSRILIEEPSNRRSDAPLTSIELRRNAHGRFERV
jgi:uncharacterized protein (TIGR02996 family)